MGPGPWPQGPWPRPGLGQSWEAPDGAPAGLWAWARPNMGPGGPQEALLAGPYWSRIWPFDPLYT